MTPTEHDDDPGLSPTPERSPTDELEYVPDDYDERPTHKQLAYLRALALRAGQTFAYPRTASQASREIRRLKQAPPSSRIERAVERKHVADALAAGPQDSACVRASEILGYGSTATWKERSSPPRPSPNRSATATSSASGSSSAATAPPPANG